MNLIERIFGIKIVSAFKYNSLEERKASLLGEKAKAEYDKELLERDVRDKDRRIKELTESERQAIIKMQETFALAESYLTDQKKAEAMYREAYKLLAGAIRDGCRLSQAEKLIIQTFVIPPICCTPVEEKINLGSDHTYPTGSEKFVRKIAVVPYVSGVMRGITHTNTIKNTRLKKRTDNSSGFILLARYVQGRARHGGDGVDIDINTTATNELQYEFIYRLLLKELDLE